MFKEFETVGELIDALQELDRSTILVNKCDHAGITTQSVGKNLDLTVYDFHSVPGWGVYKTNVTKGEVTEFKGITL